MAQAHPELAEASRQIAKSNGYDKVMAPSKSGKVLLMVQKSGKLTT